MLTFGCGVLDLHFVLGPRNYFWVSVQGSLLLGLRRPNWMLGIKPWLTAYKASALATVLSVWLSPCTLLCGTENLDSIAARTALGRHGGEKWGWELSEPFLDFFFIQNLE